jgi:hypothetical protein
MIRFGIDKEGKTMSQMVKELMPLALAAGERVTALFKKPVEMPFEKFFCIGAGTHVNLANGLSMPIESLASCPDILAYDKAVAGVRGTKCNAFMDQGVKDCIELLLADGTLLVCTPDHRILRADGEWTKAEDFLAGSDEVTMSVAFPESSEADLDLNGTFSLQLPSLGGRWTMRNQSEKLQAFARLYGLVLTDGYFGPSEHTSCGASSEVYVGHSMDADAVGRDIFLLTGKIPSRAQKNDVFRIRFPQELTAAFIDTGTVPTGKRSTHEQSLLPTFLFDEACPRAVKREFLSGLFSGDGGAPHPQYLPNGKVQFGTITFPQTRSGDHVLTEKKRMQQIEQLLLEFGVKSRGVDVRTALVSYSEESQNQILQRKRKHEQLTFGVQSGADLDPELKYVITLRLRSEATFYFNKGIGFRYCVHKQQRLSAIAGYYRLARLITIQKRSVFEEAKRIRIGGLSIPAALREAKLNVSKTETLHPHVLAWKADNVCEMLAGRSKAPGDGEDCYPPITCREYLETTGIAKFFSDQRSSNYSHRNVDAFVAKEVSDKVRYAVLKNERHFGTWRARVVATRAVGKLPVYDLNAGDMESFTAASIVVHNCPYLLCNQKRYAGLYWTRWEEPDKLDAKGLQSVRRDSCELASDAQKQTLAILFDLNEKNPVQRAVEFVQRTTGQLMRGEAEFHKLIITKALSKELDDVELKTNAAHVWLALRKAKMDPGAAAHATDRILYMMTRQQKKRGKVNGKATDVKAYECFGDDTRILTDSGFLFLEQIQERIDRGDNVTYACYDKALDQLVYAPGKLVINAADPNGKLVNFTSRQEQKNWSGGCDEYGRGENDGLGEHSNHLSIRVTPTHDMFVQTGNKATNNHIGWRVQNGETAKPSKVKAQELLSYTDQPRKCLRFLALATNGVKLSVEGDGRPSLQDELKTHLHLEGQAKVDAFLELYGFWLGDGTLSYGAKRRFKNCVRFAQKKDSDKAWLTEQIARCDVEVSVSESLTDGVTVYDISAPGWFRYFDQEYGCKYRHSGSYGSGIPGSTSAKKGKKRKLDDAPPVQSLEDIRSSTTKSAKWFMWWVLRRCSKEQVDLIIRGIQRADGCWMDGAVNKMGNPQNKQIHTSSVGFRDELIHALMHAGYTAFFRCGYRKGTVRGYNRIGQNTGRVYRAHEVVGCESEYRPIKADCWTVCWGSYEFPSAGVACYPNMHTSDITSEPYTKATWCVTVEHMDHLIVAQRAQRATDDAGRTIVTKASRPIIIGQCAEDPMTVLKLNLELNYQWYVNNQLKKPVEHVLEHVIGKEGCKKLWKGDHMRKIHRPTPVADVRNKNGILGMGNLVRFLEVQQGCSSVHCKAPLRAELEKQRGLCVSCQPDREQLRAKGMEVYRAAAAERAALLEVCRKCQHGSMLLVNACTTITCGTFSKRKKKHDEMLKAHRDLVAIANDW